MVLPKGCSKLPSRRPMGKESADMVLDQGFHRHRCPHLQCLHHLHHHYRCPHLYPSRHISPSRHNHHLRQILFIIVIHPHNQPHTMIQWVTKHCWTRDLLMISTTLKSGEHSGWRNHGFYHELSFLFVNAFSTLTYCPNRETLERAFRVWERVADLKFSEASEPPGDLEIRWGTSPGYVENIPQGLSLGSTEMGTLLMVVEERSLMLSFQGRDVYQVGLVVVRFPNCIVYYQSRGWGTWLG